MVFGKEWWHTQRNVCSPQLLQTKNQQMPQATNNQKSQKQQLTPSESTANAATLHAQMMQDPKYQQAFEKMMNDNLKKNACKNGATATFTSGDIHNSFNMP